MGDKTNIAWCDRTWNGWIGCQKVSDGCKHCYAETLMDHRYQRVKWGPQGTRERTSAANWKKPFQWNKERWMECGVCKWRGGLKDIKIAASGGFACPQCACEQMMPTRQRVFCSSLSDVFEDRPELVAWRAEMFDIISQTPNLDWLLLTKRPENIMRMLIESGRGFQDLPPHIWIGISVENQETVDKRIPELLKVPATVRFLSCEPLLGEVDLSEWFPAECLDCDDYILAHREEGTMIHDESPINWVIVGGESGQGARPMRFEWALSLKWQCKSAGVAYFCKQMGGHPNPHHELDEMPESLRVREFPQ